MPHSIFLYLGFSFMLMHEMDAMRCREWRIFPGLSSLNEKLAFQIFLFVHIPLFFIPLYYLHIDAYAEAWAKGLAYFFMVHFFLHLLFLKHKNNEFTDWISWTIISGAGLCGVLELLT